MNIFGSNNQEIGSLSENLVLNTAGKVKIRYGNKFIDILDNNGNINVSLPKIVTKVDSINSKLLNGFYLVKDALYLKYNDKIITIAGDESDEYVKYSVEQELTEEEIKNVLSNIGLRYDSSDDVSIEDGIVFINNDIYKIQSGKITKFLKEPLELINTSNPAYNESTIVWKDSSWKYLPIVTKEYFDNFLKNLNVSLNTTSYLPIRAIIMWYGLESDIPEGWHICNGGTYEGITIPDLSDKFIIEENNSLYYIIKIK